MATMKICITLMALTGSLVSGTLAKDEAQRRLSATFEQNDFTSTLLTGSTANALSERASNGLSCRAGYSPCEDEALCCPTGQTCCGASGYCAAPGETCCITSLGTLLGTCPAQWKCCGNGCAPINSVCCTDGTYCTAGRQCRTWQGERVCCLPSGCTGENGNTELQSTVFVTKPTIGAATRSADPSATSIISTSANDRSPQSQSGLSGGAIGGITVGSVAGVLIVGALLLRKKFVGCFKPREPAFDFGPVSSPDHLAPSDVSGNTAFPSAGLLEMSEQNTVYEVGPSEATSSSKPLHNVHEMS